MIVHETSKTSNGSGRIAKINSLIKRNLALLIQQKIADPRVKMVSINKVETSNDLSQSKIYITSLGKDDSRIITDVLNSAAKYLRCQLAKNITLRKTPAIKFVYDNHGEQVTRINQLIDHLL